MVDYQQQKGGVDENFWLFDEFVTQSHKKSIFQVNPSTMVATWDTFYIKITQKGHELLK